MKFYGKKLSSLEELRREREVLLYAKKHTASESLLDIKELTGGSSSSGKGSLGLFDGFGPGASTASAGLLGTLLSAFSSKSKMGIITALAPPLITLIGKRFGGTQRARKNPLERVVKEVALGYIKWKAIQMVYRWVSMAIKSNKSKNAKKEHR